MSKHATHILLDIIRANTEMQKAKALNPSYVSLFNGRSEESLSNVAPYVFEYNDNTEFSKWYFENGWGNSWGLLFKSTLSLIELSYHFRKFLLVKTENGQQLYFRFYDPRVLRIFLPTCDVQQLKEFFGPVQQFICEDEDPAYALVFSFNGRELVTQRIAADTIFKIKGEINKTSAEAPLQNQTEIKNEPETTQQPTKPKRRFFY